MDKGRERFAETVIAELRRRGVSEAIAYDEGDFRLDCASGQSFMLANAYADWQGAPRLRRGGVLRGYVDAYRAMLEPLPDAVEHARPNLMPRVRDLQFYAIADYRFATEHGESGSSLSYQRLNDQLAVEIVYDRPEIVTTIRPERLEAWGLSFEEALRSARANLRERTEGTFKRRAAGLFTSPWQDAYDASRLLLTELIVQLDVRGDPVALLPHRDHLIITGSEDVDGLGRAVELANSLLGQDRRETGHAFVWRGGRWEGFMPPDGHPARIGFRRLVHWTQSLDYDEQKEAIVERLKKEGRADDLFVSTYMVRKDPETGETRSVSSWTDGAPAMLPRAEWIAFVREPGTEKPRVDFVQWEDAMPLVADLMHDQGLRPERWFVGSFPDPETMTRLESLALRSN